MTATSPAVRRAVGASAVAVVLLSAVLLSGVVGASAAPFGGSGSVLVGGGTASVTTCATGGTSFEYVNSWNAGLGEYRTVALRVHGLAAPACVGSTLHVVVRDSSAASVGTGAAVVAGSSVEVPITDPADGAPASVVDGAAVILLG